MRSLIPVAELGPGEVADLDPGVRRTVLLLRDLGYETTDSGDGASKGEAGLPFAHVCIVVEPARLVEEADRLWRELQERGVVVLPVGDGPSAWIQATHDPANRIATIMVGNVDDMRLFGA